MSLAKKGQTEQSLGPPLSLPPNIQWPSLKVASAPRQAMWETGEQMSYKSVLAEFQKGTRGQACSHGPTCPIHHHGTGSEGGNKARRGSAWPQGGGI